MKWVILWYFVGTLVFMYTAGFFGTPFYIN